MGYETYSAHTIDKGLELLDNNLFNLVLLDNQINDDLGIDFISSIKQKGDPIIIMMTAFPDSDTAIQATKKGAFDFILKPFDSIELKKLVQKASQISHANQDKVQLITSETIDPQQDAIIGKSKAMQEIYKAIGQVTEKNVNILIQGETGTGKELAARAIHQHSLRKNNIFMPINCAAIPKDLIESELFGHEKGSFTGAHHQRAEILYQLRIG